MLNRVSATSWNSSAHAWSAPSASQFGREFSTYCAPTIESLVMSVADATKPSFWMRSLARPSSSSFSLRSRTSAGRRSGIQVAISRVVRSAPVTPPPKASGSPCWSRSVIKRSPPSVRSSAWSHSTRSTAAAPGCRPEAARSWRACTRHARHFGRRPRAADPRSSAGGKRPQLGRAFEPGSGSPCADGTTSSRTFCLANR